MAIRKRNLIRVVFLFVFALSALGFRFTPDPSTEPGDSPLSQRNYNYIDVLIWRDFFWKPVPLSFSGSSSPVPVSLNINQVTSNFGGEIQVGGAYGYLPIFGGGAGFILHGSQVHKWKISGTFAPSPDCSLVLFIDEDVLPHSYTSCGPLVGCVTSSYPSDHISDILVQVPLNNGYAKGKAGVESSGAEGFVHIAVVNADLPDETCNEVFSGLP